MKITDIFKRMFGSRNTINISIDHVDSSMNEIAIDSFTLQIAVNFIASCIAKCKFKTFNSKGEYKGEEYFNWNFQPNKNQNATEFVQQLVSKMLLKNECLVIFVNGEYLIADNFTRTEFGINEDYFDNVVVKTLTFQRRFYMHEVFYYRYNNENVRNYINYLMSSYNEVLKLAKGKYKRAGGRKGVVNLETLKKGDEKYDKEIDDLFQNKFKSYFEGENTVLSLPKGVEYDEKQGDGSKKQANELNDIIKLIDESFSRVSQAFRIPPTLLKGETANIKDVVNNFISFCIDPIVKIIETENNRKLYSKENLLNGCYMKVDTSSINHIDMFAVAEKIDKLIASGPLCIDDIREAIGMPPMNTDWSKKHWITKNYQDITNLEEGGLNSG